jgi:uncharacterized coiled-coil protein SlyX
MRMREYGNKRTCRDADGNRGTWRVLALAIGCFGFPAQVVVAQAASQQAVSEQIQKLTDAIVRTQSQLNESQRQLDELRRQLAVLQSELTASQPTPAAPDPPASVAGAAPQSSDANAAQLNDLRDRLALQESQIATLDQEKVESQSKYPVSVTGMLLLNGFVNTNAVDMAATPTVAIGGPGTTGASLRQTVLGFDARGPHLFGARTFGDLRVDFYGNPQSTSTGALYYYTNPALLRLRTAHAALEWRRTEAFFSLDRPVFNPDTPTSLTAVAEPALAWSGNLWTWNPELGARQDLPIGDTRDMRFEAALVSVGDAPITPPSSSSPALASGSEQSRWPGVEAHVALLGSGANEESNRIGVGGYFAPHHSSLGFNYDAWAGTLDGRLFLPAHLQWAGSFYRGLALGGLGGGAYKDFAYAENAAGNYYFRALDDVGGWTQLKEKFNERLELNAAFGLDNVFARELRPYAVSDGNPYLNLARNRTYTGNVIFSPSAYILFSLEYRHLESAPVVGLPAASNIIGLGAGYKF